MGCLRPLADLRQSRHSSVVASYSSIAIASALLLGLGAAQARAAACDLGELKSMAELRSTLAQRAVEVVSRAAKPEPEGRLSEFIASSATFSLGAGDVGRSLGVGTAGAISLAQEMDADRFRFLGWDYIPTPVSDACGTQKVEVEFVNSRRNEVFPMTFTFKGGLIVDAAGWSHSFQTGQVRQGPPAYR